RLPEVPARVEQCPRRVDVDAHPEVELRFRLTAHDRREVVHEVDIVLDHRLREALVGDGSGPPLDARIVDAADRGIDGDERRDRRHVRRAGEECRGETTAEKSARAGDEYLHAGSVLAWRRGHAIQGGDCNGSRHRYWQGRGNWSARSGLRRRAGRPPPGAAGAGGPRGRGGWGPRPRRSPPR